MPRYIKEFQIITESQTVHSAVAQYLQSEGYEYVHYDGENVFKKGNGVISNPTFFKFSYVGNTVRMETWMKYAFFPGVYIGEIGLTGMVGAAVKGPWKKRIQQIEVIAIKFAGQTPEYTNYAQDNTFCASCGLQIPEETMFCPRCGQKHVGSVSQSAYNMGYQNLQNDVLPEENTYVVPNGVQLPPPSQFVSKKDFIKYYAQPSLKKNITSIAILCYICAGITFLFACLFNPLGIIDAFILAGLALGMHLVKSKGFAIAILILSIVECIFALASGSFPFWWLVAGVSAVMTFSKLDKQYKEFLNRQ